jgi:hypothetical protein
LLLKECPVIAKDYINMAIALEGLRNLKLSPRADNGIPEPKAQGVISGQAETATEGTTTSIPIHAIEVTPPATPPNQKTPALETNSQWELSEEEAALLPSTKSDDEEAGWETVTRQRGKKLLHDGLATSEIGGTTQVKSPETASVESTKESATSKKGKKRPKRKKQGVCIDCP